MLDKLISLYREPRPRATPSDLFFEIASDRTFGKNATEQAERKAEQGGSPIFKYYFTYNTPIDDGRYRAFHTAELPLVLRLVKFPETEALSRHLSAAWASFARAGNPNHAGLPDWPAFDLKSRATMVFDAQKNTLIDDPGREKRLFWKNLQ
jgi:para-nitrobenzyl esterase